VLENSAQQFLDDPLPPDLPPPSLHPKKHFRRIVKPALIPLLLAVLIAAIAIAYVEMQKPKSFEECLSAKNSFIEPGPPPVCVTASGDRFIEPGQTNQSNVIVTISDITSWLLHPNSEHHFTFKFPPEFTIIDDEESTKIVSFNAGSGTEDSDLTYSAEVIVHTNVENRTATEFINDHANSLTTSIPGWNRTKESERYYLARKKQITDSFKPYTVNNINGVSGDFDGQRPNYTIIHLEGNQIYQFTLWGSLVNDPPISPQSQAIFDKILSTFRFNDVISFYDDWPEFSYEDLGYVVKYPHTWNVPNILPQSTRTEVDFDGHFTVVTGIYYDQVKQRPLTYEEYLFSVLPTNNPVSQDITIGGLPAKQVTYKNGESVTEHSIVVPHGDGKQFISISYRTYPDDIYGQDIMAQVLKSFRFMTLEEIREGTLEYSSPLGFKFTYPKRYDITPANQASTGHFDVAGFKSIDNFDFSLKALVDIPEYAELSASKVALKQGRESGINVGVKTVDVNDLRGARMYSRDKQNPIPSHTFIKHPDKNLFVEFIYPESNPDIQTIFASFSFTDVIPEAE